MENFVHLHVHTEYSLLDGAGKIEELVAKAKELGMESIAITDHGVMYGVVDFYKQAKKHGVKPIIGCEVYVAPRTMGDRDPKLDAGQYHMVLLAENEEGYNNLIKLVSMGFTEGFYYKPRVDIETLRKYSKGIIALSACLAGAIPENIVNGNYEAAKAAALLYNDVFGEGNFYLELQDHGIKEQSLVNQEVIRLSRETGIPLVATNDVHYVKKEDAAVQDILLCIQTGKTVLEEDRLKFQGQEFYLKSQEDMYELFKYIPEALENTEKIAEKCSLDFSFGQVHLPVFDVPEGYTSDTYIRKLCYDGLKKKYGGITDELKDRAEHELSVITSMGYSDYYLIVWDYVKFAKDNGIMVGPGRGSGAGSLVAYCLGITNIDPIKYNLIFERFLNPERISMPDFDVDFCYERRQEVIDYVVGKYGKDRVAQIITFGTMAARAAIRDVGRALDIPYAQVDLIAKKIPFEIGMTIEKALAANSELRKLYEEDEGAKHLIDMSKAVEGMPRHSSTHAAGVVISEKAITEYVPLQMNEDVITTQFAMGTLEELGLLKMDFLGLRTLTVIRDTLRLIEEKGAEVPDVDNLKYDDPNIFRMISQGDTYGVFQLESGGMVQCFKELKPNCLEDIIAGISLYRPGAMDQIPMYIRNKHNPDKIRYMHPALEHILDVTYGCIIYQEQVMQIVRDLGGYSMGRSDIVRRAMGKKKADVMAKERENFINGIVDEAGNILVAGCVRNGIPAKTAAEIFDEVAKFAGYGFNKSHAAAYAIIAYQTAWLKYYYPVEFSAALITSVMGNTKKVAEYIQHCKGIGIEVLPPDINESSVSFTVRENKIRFGLAAVKNVGINAILSIIKARKERSRFEGLYDFLQKIDYSVINKRTVESLIKCGAFDRFGVYRSRMLAVYEKLIDSIQLQKKINVEGQISLFDTMEESGNLIGNIYPEIKEHPKKNLLAMEKEMIGLYISGHPLEEYEPELKSSVTVTTADLLTDIESETQNMGNNPELDGKKVTMGGIITSVKQKTTKTNNMMAFVELEDLYGTLEIIVFPKTYERFKNLLLQDSIVLVGGRISQKEEEAAKIICDTVAPLKKYMGKKLYIKINTELQPGIIEKLETLLIEHRGIQPVILVNEADGPKGKRQVIKVDSSIWVDINDILLNDLKEVAGQDCVVAK
ncbi:MAG TPA: DNA polymerase III subunit alpha [Bacillota bacterium]|nr:DNA polymerase III subunit alpha [Bacillota bacterium]